MASFIARAARLPDSPTDRFADVSGTHHGAVHALVDAGITDGCNPPANDRFCPTETVSRAQMASFIARALDLSTETGHPFTDVGHPHADAIAAVAAADIAAGCAPTRFCPDEPVTREQAASFLVRAFDL